jgi:hypothetical protein
MKYLQLFTLLLLLHTSIIAQTELPDEIILTEDCTWCFEGVGNLEDLKTYAAYTIDEDNLPAGGDDIRRWLKDNDGRINKWLTTNFTNLLYYDQDLDFEGEPNPITPMIAFMPVYGMKNRRNWESSAMQKIMDYLSLDINAEYWFYLPHEDIDLDLESKFEERCFRHDVGGWFVKMRMLDYVYYIQYFNWEEEDWKEGIGATTYYPFNEEITLGSFYDRDLIIDLHNSMQSLYKYLQNNGAEHSNWHPYLQGLVKKGIADKLKLLTDHQYSEGYNVVKDSSIRKGYTGWAKSGSTVVHIVENGKIVTYKYSTNSETFDTEAKAENYRLKRDSWTTYKYEYWPNGNFKYCEYKRDPTLYIRNWYDETGSILKSESYCHGGEWESSRYASFADEYFYPYEMQFSYEKGLLKKGRYLCYDDLTDKDVKNSYELDFIDGRRDLKSVKLFDQNGNRLSIAENDYLILSMFDEIRKMINEERDDHLCEKMRAAFQACDKITDQDSPFYGWRKLYNENKHEGHGIRVALYLPPKGIMEACVEGEFIEDW